MARVPIIIINNGRLLLSSPRTYCMAAAAAAAEKELVKVQLDNSRKVKTEKMKDGKNNNVFWMRDPKSGFWIPETHFDDVNVVDLRNQLLP